MSCKSCGEKLYYESSNKVKDNVFKVVNGNKYFLRYCEKCLIENLPAYNNLKDRKRAFNTLSRVTKFAFCISDEDYNVASNLRKKTLDNFIRKHGKEEGEEKWNLYRKKLAYSNTLEYHIEKYGEEKGLEKYKRYSAERSCTKENFIRRHGKVEGLVRWESYVKRQSYTESLEYCLEKFGEEGYLIYLQRSKNKALSKEKFISKYGKEKGEERWNSYRKKYIESFSRRSRHSKKAQSFFDKLKKSLSHLNLSFCDSSNKEKFFVNKSGYFASVDFYINELDINK